MTDKRVSILIKNQLPDFVLEDHPRFVSFIEAYYEFLDNTSYGKAKDMRHIYDVDLFIDEFEQQFFNSFIPYLPRETKVNKEFLIKNILPLYLSKGSEKSFKYLFRLLFDTEAEIDYPGKYVLRASNSKWVYENILRISTDIYSTYISDGERTIYFTPEMYEPSDIKVYIDGVYTVDYDLYKESMKFILNNPPSEGSEIKVLYNNFTISMLENRKITGSESGSSAIIERTGIRRLYGSNYYEILVDSTSLNGTFTNGEYINTDVIINDKIIPITLESFSDIYQITITNGGASYNVGDPVKISGISKREAVAIVGSVTSGKIENLNIINPGCGFKVGNNVEAVGYSTEFFNASIASVDDSGTYTPNTIIVNTDIISEYSNVTLDSIEYGFGQIANDNINSIIINTWNMSTLSNIGPITSINIYSSLISTTLSPKFDARSEVVAGTNTLRNLSSIGKIKINNGGTGYEVGDQLIFHKNVNDSGQGANAYVLTVDANGAITNIHIENGGLSYNVQSYPSITISSTLGEGANLQVQSVLGDGELLTPVLSNTAAGMILSINILDSGMGYVTIPGINMRDYGDGTATAEASIRDSYIQLGGQWKTIDSLISTEEIVLQGKDYYIDFSYIISAQVEFAKYKNILKNMLHPAGLVNYVKYKIEKEIDINVQSTISSTINIYSNDEI
jgi:hypothetical protein